MSSFFQGPSLVKFSHKEMHHLLDDPKGPVGQHLRRIGLQILVGARSMVGVRTGKLKRSLYMRQGLRGRVQYVEVGATDSKAFMHHEGTKRHDIRSDTGRILRFNVGGKVVYVRKVDHPGTKPNPYLTVPMRRAVRR